MSNWHETTKAKPCPACGHAGWCAWAPDGALLRCMRTGTTPAGMRRIKADGDGGTLYGLDDPARRPRTGGGGSHIGIPAAPKAVPDAVAAVNWKDEAERLRAAMASRAEGRLMAKKMTDAVMTIDDLASSLNWGTSKGSAYAALSNRASWRQDGMPAAICLTS